MDFLSVDATNHILIPTAYNRIMRCVKSNSSVHNAYTQAEIHKAARRFESPVLYIPRVYDVLNNKQYETECIYHEKKDRVAPYLFQLFPVLFVELFRFKEFMFKEGYFMRDITIIRMSKRLWAVIDFSKFGYIDKNKVRFPKQRFTYTLDEAEKDYGLKVARLGDYYDTKIERVPTCLAEAEDLYC